MRIRTSVKIFAGACLTLCLGIWLFNPASAFNADPVQFVGTEFFTNGGATQAVQTVTSTPTVVFQQIVAPASAESSIVNFTTGSANTAIFGFTTSGHYLVNASTQAPTANPAGTCTLGAGASDTHGNVAFSGGATPNCTLTFASKFTNAPDCFVVNESTTGFNAPVQSSATATTLSITQTSSARNDTFAWFCISR